MKEQQGLGSSVLRAHPDENLFDGASNSRARLKQLFSVSWTALGGRW